MPAARCEGAEDRTSGAFVAQVEGLRIIFAGEGLDLLGVEMVDGANEALAYAEVFEEQPLRGGAGPIFVQSSVSSALAATQVRSSPLA